MGKLKKGINSHTPMLSFLTVYLFLPAKIFRSFSQYCTVSYISNNYKLLLISLAVLVVLHFTGILVARIFRVEGHEKGVYEYTVTVSNYGYLGYTLIEGVFGGAALTNMILFCLPFSIYTYTVGYMKLTGGKFSIKRLLNPVTIATALGMLVGVVELEMPAVVNNLLSASASCVGPVTMLLTGLTLSEFSIGRMLGDVKVYLLTAIRLVILPAIAFVSFKLLHLEDFLAPALIMCAMPSGLNTIIFPKNLGRSPELGAKLALITHACALFILPVWLMLLQ